MLISKLKLGIFVLVAAGLLTTGAGVAEKPQTRVDRFGDPLPPGAIRRFGTLRRR